MCTPDAAAVAAARRAEPAAAVALQWAAAVEPLFWVPAVVRPIAAHRFRTKPRWFPKPRTNAKRKPS